MGHDTTEEAHVDPAAGSEPNVVLGALAALVVALFGLVCGYSSPPAAADEQATAAVSYPGADTPRVVRGAHGAIATAAPEASAAGLDVLRAGGNAYDALIAASFAAAVARPQSTGLGGGGFVVWHHAATKTQGAIDGREMAPSAATRAMYVDGAGKVTEDYKRGPRSAAVPGLVAMLHHLYEEHGSKRVTWSRLLQPAIELAEEGVVVDGPLARAIEQYEGELSRWHYSKQLFLPGGRRLRQGDLLVQRDLARTLREVAANRTDGFYTGWVATAIADDTAAHGGLITREDLASYEVKTREAVRGTYRGKTVVSMPPPSSGGTHLVQMLNILSGFDLRAMGWHGPDHLHVLTETMRRAYADRSKYMADPDFVDVPVAQLTDPGYARRLFDGIDRARATPSNQIAPGSKLQAEHPQTTHISVIDDDGNAVASTQTINTGLGSCFVAGNTGVILNNEMNDFTAKANVPNEFGLIQSEGNLPEPGKRPLSSMTPTIVLDADGKVWAVIGTPGGAKIITTVLQLLSNLVDYEMSAEDAVQRPRIHHQWLPDVLQLENGIGGAGLLTRRGHARVRQLDANSGLGNAQVVVVRDGIRIAVSDRRGTGRPGAY